MRKRRMENQSAMPHLVRECRRERESIYASCLWCRTNLTDRNRNHSYTWLNSKFEPIELPAFEYITLMQRWISGKIDDTKMFPTEASGVSFSHNPQITTTGLLNG